MRIWNQSLLEGTRASFKGHISRWAKYLCILLVTVIGLQGTLAQAQTVYYHNDIMGGSPVAATDEAGNLLWRESYRPYGERMLRPAAANAQWFHGKQVDADTELQDFGARNYDAVLGRFLSIDPVDFNIENVHSFNRYAYGNNNPLKYKDPDGKSAIEYVAIAIGIGAILIGAGRPATAPLGGVPPTPAETDAGVSVPPGLGQAISNWLDNLMDAKRGPKTNGEGPHNEKIREEAERLKALGHTILAGGGGKEVLVPTPGGKKKGRRPDIISLTPEGKKRGVNVGLTTSDGEPVPREKEALEDLNGPGDLPTDFVPYDKPPVK